MANSKWWGLWLAIALSGCFSEPERVGTTNNDTTSSSTNNTSGTTGCVPSAEVCDGADNDCDGEVDNGFDLGAACAVGLGACEVAGVTVCAAAGDATTCDVEPAAPGEELCGDEVDNDCDGAVDEGFFDLGEACTSGLGVCLTPGEIVCAPDGVGTVCGAEPLEPPEVEEATCDGLDNDCDGATDEGCDDDADGYCDASFALVLPGATPLCPNGGGDCNDDVADVYPGAPGACDGVDNDCDGQVDEIKRSTAVSFSVGAAAAADLETSPVQAIASDSGFCIAMTGGTAGARSLVRAHLETGSASNSIIAPVTETGREERVADVEWNGNNCAAIVIESDGDATLDARLHRWSKTLATGGAAVVINDGIGHISPSWDASLTFANNLWVAAYATTSGSAANYRTMPAMFGTFDTASPPLSTGLNGTFPELGPSPGTRTLLFASNFANINVHELNVGEPAVAVAGLNVPSSVFRSSLAINGVGSTTWFAVRHASNVMAWEIRAITDQLSYGPSGLVPYASAVEPQDFISRNPFVAGPLQTTWFLDSVDEVFVVIGDDGAGGLTTDTIVDPDARGHVLTARQIDADVTEVLWLREVGGNGQNSAFEAAEYTCF